MQILEKFRIYKKTIINTIQECQVYRLNHFLSFLCVALPLIGVLLLWNTIYSQTENIGGYTSTMMITYFILAIWVGEITAPCLWGDISQDIKDGKLSQYLSMPLSYHWYNFSVYLGAKIPYSIVGMLITCMVIVFTKDKFFFQLNAIYLTLFFVVIVLAFFLGYQITYLLSLVAFWLEDASGPFQITSVATTILMGSLVPLDLLPDSISYISKFLPFQYLLYFPVKIYLGKVSNNSIISGIFCLLLWIVVFFFLNKLIWKKGIKRYSAVGG